MVHCGPLNLKRGVVFGQTRFRGAALRTDQRKLANREGMTGAIDTLAGIATGA